MAKRKKTKKPSKKSANKPSRNAAKRAARKATAQVAAQPAPEGAERRRHPRASLNLLVQHRFESLDEFMEEVAIDISVGGMFLRTDKPRAEGQTVYLRFALADGLPLVEGIGKVVRVNSADDSGRQPGMGIEFVSLDDESRRLIDSIVRQKYSSDTAGADETQDDRS